MGEKIRGKKWKNLIKKNNECILPFGLINKKINGKEKIWSFAVMNWIILAE